MTKKNSINKLLLFGHVFECFDDSLYGFFAVLLSEIFFPSSSYSANLMSSYGSFAAGFFARPIGAVLFGLYGDKIGRRKPLLYSLILIGIPTFIIGIIPSYEAIGILAPFTLIFCRLAQGLFMGGGYTGANLYLSENNFQNDLGAKTGFLVAAGVFGAVLATIFGMIMTLSFMPSWAWRIPFLFGALSTFGIFFYRLQLSETESFQQEKQKENLLKFPLAYLFKEHKTDLLRAGIIAGLALMPLYYSTIFGNRLFKELGYTYSESMFLNMIAMALLGLLIYGGGKVADKIGFGCHMLIATFLIAILTFPAFFLVSRETTSAFHVYGFVGILVFVAGIINGCAMPYIASFFPTKCRYSGVALSVTTGQAIFGGTAPLIASWLTDMFQSRYAPAFWLTFLATIASISILYKELFEDKLSRFVAGETHPSTFHDNAITGEL